MKIKTITDEEILDLILAGRIVIINLDHPNPIISKDGKILSPYIVKGSRCGDCERWAVHICLPRKKGSRRKKSRQRSIVRSKIVWMFEEKRVVPFAHELHHKDEDRLNDRASNIIDWTEKKHREYHNGNGVPF